MPREKEDWRDTIAMINGFYPKAGFLTVEQIGEVLQYKSMSTVRVWLKEHKVPIENGRVNVVTLARAMCS